MHRFSTILVLTAALAIEACAQIPATPATPTPQPVTVSFSHQALYGFVANFGAKIPSVAAYSANTCLSKSATAAVDIDSGFIRRAAETKFPVQDPALLAAALTKARASNKKVKIARGLEELSGLISVFGASGVIKMSSTALTAIVSTIPILHQAQGYFDAQSPPPLGSIPLLSGTLHLTPGSCTQSIVIGGYVKGLDVFTVDVNP